MTRICWRFSENFESPKNYKIDIFNTPKFLFLLWRLDIQNDWFEVVRKNQQIFKKCEKFLKNGPPGPPDFGLVFFLMVSSHELFLEGPVPAKDTIR